MPHIFSFARLVRKYSIDFTFLQAAEGRYDDTGEWVHGEAIETTHRGVIAPYSVGTISASMQALAAGGILTADDRRLFMLYRLPIQDDSRVVYRDRLYAITEENADQLEYGDTIVYRLKYMEEVSAHAQPAGHQRPDASPTQRASWDSDHPILPIA